MADVKAISILTAQIEQFKKISNPPESVDGIDAYNTSVRQVLDGGQSTVLKVKTYVEHVELKLQELKDAPNALVKKNQDAIQKLLDSILGFKAPTAQDTSLLEGKFQTTTSQINDSKMQAKALAQLQLVHELEKTSQTLINDRLNELVRETEVVCAKLKDGADVWQDDIAGLMGCLDSWKNAKAESHEDELRQKKQKENEERQRREDAAKRKKEEEEKKKREDDERKRRKREEEERKAEEERKRIEEEERVQKQEALSLQREAEEKLKREEAERRQRLEDEKKRCAEADARRKEQQRLRLEAEQKEKERQQKEAAERSWRQDPNNWKPVVYDRPCDAVDGKRKYHGGISCVMASPPGGIEADDLECFASDEVDSIIEVLENDEKPVSSIINITSRKGNLQSEVPSRIYVPHHSVLSPGDEIVIKVSINGRDWITMSPVQPSSQMSEHEEIVKRIVGVEVNNFTNLKAIVVTRPRCQTIIVDRPGISVYSSMDKNVKLFVPREAFLASTELKLMVQTVYDETLSGFLKENDTLGNILSVSSFITLICEKPSAKTMEVDLLKASQKQGGGKFQRGKSYQLYTTKDKQWKFADIEFKGHQEDLTVMLPAGRGKYTIMELEMPASFPKENVLGIADVLHKCINKTTVCMIVKQQEDNPSMCAIRVVRREKCRDTLAFLAENGYTEGPNVSAEFNVQEGQHLQLYCTGNIETATDTNPRKKLTYLSYMGGAEMDMSLGVKDSWKQKDLPAFVGTIRCIVLKDDGAVDTLFTRTIDLNVSLPKPVRLRTSIRFARVRFPHYLTSLASYLSRNMCNADDKHIWQDVLRSLLGNSEFDSGYRIAKRKCVDDMEEPVCRAMLLDWLKSQAMHDDKLPPIKTALIHNGNRPLAESCTEFVRYHKENLSDAALADLATGVTKDVRTFGEELGLQSSVIERCIKDHPSNTKQQCNAILAEWRESDDVMKHGEKALEFLRRVCV